MIVTEIKYVYILVKSYAPDTVGLLCHCQLFVSAVGFAFSVRCCSVLYKAVRVVPVK